MNETQTEQMPVLGRCKKCDYALWSAPEDIRQAASLSDVHPGAAYRMTDKGNLLARCPNKHTVFRLYQVEGEFDPDVKCDGRCEGARGHKCVCACGGMNHGRGHAQHVENVSEAVEVVDGQIVDPKPVYDPAEHGERREPTDAQIAFVIVLASERGIEFEDESVLREMDRMDVSAYIDSLKATPKRPRDEYVPADADGWGKLVDRTRTVVVDEDELEAARRDPKVKATLEAAREAYENSDRLDDDEPELPPAPAIDVHFGEVGEQISGSALVTHEQDVSDATLYLFRANVDGAFGTVKWFKPSYVNVNFAKGDQVTFTAKVKRHETQYGNATLVTHFEVTE